jgi:tRNA-splicing endonuclease subunit Sen15
MAPSAITNLPPASALEQSLDVSKTALKDSPHPAYLHHLASTVLHDLQYQHDWTSLTVHTHSTLTNLPLPRPIVSGLPPRRAYIHPDEQIEILKAEHETVKSIPQIPEREWVLPTQLQEKWSLAKFTAVFTAIDTVPPGGDNEVQEGEEKPVGHQWQGKNRQKRLLLATLHDDSTVVYYIMHDGIAKPRQN